MNNAKFIALGAIVQQLLSFAVILLITRLLGADGYGEVVTLMAIATTIFNFSAQWAQPYMVRTESVSYAKNQKIGSAFFIPSLISFFILLVATYLFTHYFSKALGDISTIPVSMIYFSAISYFLFQMAKIGLQIQSRFGYYGLLLSLDKLMLLMILGSFVLFHLLTKAHVLWAYIAGTMLAGMGGLGLCLYKLHDWKKGCFLYNDYAKSIAPVSASVAIHYFSSITFVILITREIESAQFVAWIGMGNIILGVLLQPINWLAPTLAPKLSRDVLEANSHVRIGCYLQDWVLPSTLIILWITICTITVILFTPLLPRLLGNGFQDGTTIIALVALLTTAEASNLMLVQLVYARKLEKIVLLAVIFKAIPLLTGYAFGASVELLLILLNLGSWLAIAISLLGIRSYLQRKWVLQYATLGILAFLASVMVTLHSGKWLLGVVLIAITLPTILLCRRMVGRFGLDRARAKVGSGA